MTLERIELTLAVILGALIASAGLVFGMSRVQSVVISPEVQTASAVATEVQETPQKPEPPKLQTYLEVIDGCGPYFEGACVNIRSGPGTHYADVGSLRSGMVLSVGETRVVDGQTWYRIVFDESVRYPERLAKEWWVAGDYVRLFQYEGPKYLKKGETASSSKRIIVDRGEQMLYAYDGDELFMKETISTGLALTPTPRGYFTVYNMTPTRYMQGPLPGISDQYYDLPGVPWDMYFTNEGGAIHGAYWHDKFGEVWSHGCVNLPVASAQKLYEWAELGTSVLVRD